jgi:hypothetical protein
MTEEINKLIENHQHLATQAHEQYSPLVNSIIAAENKDVNHICFTMDFMLDFCFDERILLLYRSLCRYLFDIDPEAATAYVNAYREMWDEEEVKFGRKKMEERV